MEKFATIEETLGYQTAPDKTNQDERYLVEGSFNCLIDQERKVKSRAGYTRLGAANAALTRVRNAWTWHTSTGTELPQRFYDDELEVYLGTVDGTEINAWTRVAQSWSTTEKLRPAAWYDASEGLDVQVMVQGDANMHDWSGGVAIVSVVGANSVTKTGTTTFAQNRFYTARNEVFVCVRTGTEYTYTGGAGTTTLTGIADTTGLIAGDILVQKVVAISNVAASGRKNYTINVFENQIHFGSEVDNLVYITKNNDYDSVSFSTPRVSGEGGLLTLDDPVRGFANLLGVQITFCGRSSAFKSVYTQITVGATLAETLTALPLPIGVDQGALNQECIIPIGNALAYLSNEVALRIIEDPANFSGINPATYSNPIQPDFDGETWDDAAGAWFKNAIYLGVPASSRAYILEFTQDADGKVRRYWQPPQILPIGPLSIISSALHGHSNAVPETYTLFSGDSDGEYSGIDPADKLPIHMKMNFVYRIFKDRERLKTFDEYFSEGQIRRNTRVTARLLYGFGGSTQIVERTIDGSDEDITFQDEDLTSLGQSSLGSQPLGGSSVEPSDAMHYNVTFEIAKEDFLMVQEQYEMDGIVDGYFAVISRGMNAALSPRKNIAIKK